MRSDPVRVAVDLETTGLRPDQDAIIEIGAVKFAGARILDTYQSFVSLSGLLPYRIQRLTGIVPADLRRAPALASLLPVLRAFLGDFPLVGHSVAFDAAFLRRAGLVERNPLIDTYELASMLLPSLPGYTLGAVAGALAVPTSIHHRALADADLARAVLLALLARLDSLDTRALDDLAALPAPPGWTPAPLIRAQARARNETVSASPFAALLPSLAGADLTSRGLDPALAQMAIYAAVAAEADEARPALGATPSAPSAPSAPSVPGATGVSGTPAPRQTPLREYLIEGGALMFEVERKDEAQLAALAEIVQWVASSGERVIIAAQDSDDMVRVARDQVPRAAACAGFPAPDIAELDEPAAYLSLRRWFGVARDPRAGAFPIEVTRGLARLTVWARETTSGLRADIALHGDEGAAWERVRDGAEFAEAVAECPYVRAGYDFAARARERAARAAIIVTTQAALAASLSGVNTSLPDAPRVVVIAGRLLEDALRQARTITLDVRSVLGDLDALAAEPDATGQRHDLFAVAAALLWPERSEKSGRKGGTPPVIGQEERAWRAAIAQARDHIRALFAALRLALHDAQESQARGGRAGRGDPRDTRDNSAMQVDAAMRDSDAWVELMDAWERLAAALTAAAAAARAAAAGRHAAPSASAGVTLGARADLLGAASRLDVTRERGAALITRDDHRALTWIRPPYAPFADSRGARATESGADESSEPAERAEALADPPSLSRFPTQVSQALRPLWREGRAESEAPGRVQGSPTERAESEAPGREPRTRPGRGLALLSWSLAVGGDVEMTREALGLPDTTRVATLTPDYSRQTLLCLPDDAAEPNAPGAQSQLEGLIVALALALEGDTVAIFPSHALLRTVAHGVRRALERHNILALAQGMDGSARQLWQNFDSQERIVLLAAGSFWDGAPRRGRAPACVVVARTPFPAPSDPLTATRAAAWADPQNQFITPQAALKLRQALGGLAWSHERRNAVVLFDRRLQTRSYGPTILSALPDCAQYQGSLSALPERVATWTRGED